MPTAGKNSAVLKIGTDITDPQKAIAEINALLRKMGENVNAQSSIAVKAFRAEAEAAGDMLRKLGASDKQMGDLARTTQRVEQASAAHLTKVGSAARSLAGGFESMVRSGTLAGDAAKQVIAQGADIAFMFGPAGAIAGAVAIGAGTIVEYFQRARREMEETRKKFQDELAQMVNAGNFTGLQKKLQDLEIGEPGSGIGQGGGFKGSMRDLQARADSLLATAQTTKDFREATDALKERKKLLDQLAEKRKEYDAIAAILLNPPTMPRAITGLPTVSVTAPGPAHEAKPATPSLSPDDRRTIGQRAALSAPVSQPFDVVGFGRVSDSVVNAIQNPQGPSFFEQVAADVRSASGELTTFQGSLQSLTSGTIMSFADASVNAFTQWASGSKKIGDALRQGVGGAIVDIAGKKAKLYFAEALADTAEGFLGHPGAWAAAGEHAAAGAAMLAIAGAGARIGATGGGTGGGTRGASFNEGLGSSFADTGKGDATITIYGGILDTSDVRQMDALADAIRAISGRNINIRPSGGAM